ncbi:MAG TPA: hypothetical protein EYP85_14780 [Armatimonadetes bacterium]|nr:hypothetical protein [Armatimonadota bacterium]
MTSRQRLLTAMQRQQPDRVPIHLRGVQVWSEKWLQSKDESFAPLIEAVREVGDWVATWSPGGGPFLTVLEEGQVETQVTDANDWTLHQTTVPTPRGPLTCIRQVSKGDYPSLTKKFWVETAEDYERFLSLPYLPPQPEVGSFFALEREMGERALVMASFLNPIGYVHALLGSELLALWSIAERSRVQHLIALFAERVYNLVEYLLDRGVRGVYGTLGQEYAGPPLLSPRDFHEFVTKPEQPITQLLHDHGCLLHVHCHGPMEAILEEFVALGTDCLHPLEAPPMGDITLAEAKRRIGREVCLEGNIQVGDLYASTPERIRDLTKAALDAAAAGGGFILCPTASPYTRTLPPRAAQNYLTMIETGLEYGRY